MRNRSFPEVQAGVSMVELMVGLAIGLVAVVVMLQVFTASNSYKQATTGGDDAQNNGAIALYGLQRDLRQAGYGLSAFNVLGCNLLLRTGVTVSGLGPVVINHANIPAGDAGSDTLTVYYGIANDAVEGDRIGAQISGTYTLTSFTNASGTPSVAVNDRVVAQADVAAPPSPCNLTLDTVQSVSASDVTMATGVAGVTGGSLFNLGAAPQVLVYAVRGATLTVCDYMVNNCGAGTLNPAHWVPVANNIAALRAQYGRDTAVGAMDGFIDAYDQSTPTTACGWFRTRGLRVALVARSAQSDMVAATPTWAGSATHAFDLSADSNWQRYRYRVFETVVPLRNMTWMGVQPGC